jgi:hypothetical protein
MMDNSGTIVPTAMLLVREDIFFCVVAFCPSGHTSDENKEKEKQLLTILAALRR